MTTFSGLLRQSPADLVNQALADFHRRDRDAAAAKLAQLMASGDDIGKSWGPVSRLAVTLGETAIALDAAERHLAAEPGNPAVRLAYGELLAQQGRSIAARDQGIAMVRDHPRNPAAWHFLGTCRSQLGEIDASIADLRKAISLQTTPAPMAWSWQAIAEAKKFKAGDPQIDRMLALLKKLPEAPDTQEARSVLLSALGKAHDDLGQVDKAFGYYAQAAAIMKRLRHYVAADTEGFVDQVVEGWTTEFAQGLPPSGLESGRPIFVLGLPRSGTTLIEQILVSHPDVVDGAEMSQFGTASMPIQGFTPSVVKAFAERTGSEGFAAIGRAYLRMLDQRFGTEGRIVDKTLNHSRFLGLIHHVLPNARFIWLSRAPGGVAWSCFRTRFGRGVDWTWSQDDMGRYFQTEDALREHWTGVMGDAILTVPYEAVVADIEPWIARILDHVGLPFHEGLSQFHKTERAVTTASFAQVRQPLYTTSVEAWRRYETHLQPFFDAYENKRGKSS